MGEKRRETSHPHLYVLTGGGKRKGKTTHAQRVEITKGKLFFILLSQQRKKGGVLACFVSEERGKVFPLSISTSSDLKSPC